MSIRFTDRVFSLQKRFMGSAKACAKTRKEFCKNLMFYHGGKMKNDNYSLNILLSAVLVVIIISQVVLT